MKNYLITASIVIASATGGVLLDNAVLNPTDTVTTPDSTFNLTVSAKQTTDNGKTRYDIYANDTTFFSFTSFEQIEKFANTDFDPGDDDLAKNLRAVIKQELQTQTAEEYINSIKQ